MRTFVEIFLVAISAAVFANCGHTATLATRNDEPSEKKVILECIRSQMEPAIDGTQKSTTSVLRELAREGKVNRTLDSLDLVFNNLKRAVENTAQDVIADRADCEKGNEASDIRRNCDFLAKLAYIQKTSKIFTSFMNQKILTFIEAEVVSEAGDIWHRALDSARDNNEYLMRKAATAAKCFQTR